MGRGGQPATEHRRQPDRHQRAPSGYRHLTPPPQGTAGESERQAMMQKRRPEKQPAAPVARPDVRQLMLEPEAGFEPEVSRNRPADPPDHHPRQPSSQAADDESEANDSPSTYAQGGRRSTTDEGRTMGAAFNRCYEKRSEPEAGFEPRTAWHRPTDRPHTATETQPTGARLRIACDPANGRPLEPEVVGTADGSST